MVWGDGGHSALMGAFAAMLAAGAGSVDFWQNIGNVGFPIAVATFLLLKLSPRLEELTAAVKDLTAEIQALKQAHSEDD